MKNKKGIQSIMSYIFISLFITFIGLFVGILMWETIKSYMITPLTDTINSSMGSLLTTTGTNNINDIKTFSLGFDFGFDLLFLLAVLVTFLTTLVLAYQKEPLSRFSFLFSLFGGSFITIFIIYFIEDILLWFVESYIINLFSLDLVFVTYFITNIGLILYFWFLFLLVVNQAKNFTMEEYFRE